MKISTEEFINLIEERPALWKKSHPDFLSKETRIRLLRQISSAAKADATECAKKLKNLKDSMRAQVAKLPRTSSGLPAFELSDQYITWPLYRPMLFMKDEFIFLGRKLTMTQILKGASEFPEAVVEENFTQRLNEFEELSDDQSASSSSSVPLMASPQSKTSGSGKKRKHFHRISSPSDFEEMKYAMLEKAATTDELDVFASDIANDLRKIKCPLKLMQAKSKIRRIAEEFAVSELLSSAVTNPS